jgi:hypothetical protein
MHLQCRMPKQLSCQPQPRRCRVSPLHLRRGLQARDRSPWPQSAWSAQCERDGRLWHMRGHWPDAVTSCAERDEAAGHAVADIAAAAPAASPARAPCAADAPGTEAAAVEAPGAAAAPDAPPVADAAARRADLATGNTQRISRIDRVVRDDRIYTNGMIMGPVRRSSASHRAVIYQSVSLWLHIALECRGGRIGACI